MEGFRDGNQTAIGTVELDEGSPDVNPLEDPEERRVVFAAIDSFYQYRKNAHFNTTHRRRQNLYALPTSQWRMLADPPFSLLDTLNAIDDSIDDNADLADEIVKLALMSFSLPQAPSKESPLYWHQTAKPNDMSKAHSTLRQFYRDWSSEGYLGEVKPILDRVLVDLKHALPPLSSSATPPTVLLPGAGLGRLLFELCLAGYSATGNEISYHQLLASNFILNNTRQANQYSLYPFATTFTNNLSRTNQLKRVAIPDIHPATTMHQVVQSGRRVGEMNMTAGDFVLAYSSSDCASTFDAVITIFFIDTAPNLIRYIETVRGCLVPGGVWINIGPLLWHFDDRTHSRKHEPEREDEHNDKSNAASHVHAPEPQNHSTSSSTNEDTGIGEPGSFELTNDEVIQLLEKMGFKVESEEIMTNSGMGYGYIQDPDSMLQNTYRCSHWVARKVM